MHPTASAAAVEPLAGNAGEAIRVRGARTHNLRSIDVDIPRDQLVVITGPSGSGKSSLAFDTIYAEGQRQYFEGLSTYARQFLDQLERPDCDLIEGLQPTIAIDQRPGSHNPRSTVATVTEIYDYLRLAMARLGTPACPQCGAAISQQTPEEIVDALAALPEGTKAMLLAPLVRGRKGEHAEVFDSVRKAGLVRVRVDGTVHDLDALPPLARNRSHTIEVVVDRVVIRPGLRPRLAEAVDRAVRHGEGVVIVCRLAAGGAGWEDQVYSTRYACPACKLSFTEIEPRSFSFNSPYGACPTCEGLGVREQFDRELVVPDAGLSLAGGAVAPWRGKARGRRATSGNGAAKARRTESRRAALEALAKAVGGEVGVPLADWPPKRRERLLDGDGKQFAGLLATLETEYAAADDDERERLEAFRGRVHCPACGGARLRPEARAVRLGGRAIHEITALSIEAAVAFLAGLPIAEGDRPIAERTLGEIVKRLEFLRQVGLDYLSLDRPADTLSGGESQRVRLAAGIGAGLVGVCYVLDEPSIGLHPRDNQRLIHAMRGLQAAGNTLLVVEHDEAIIRQADRLIDLGPGAGREGGLVTAEGTPAEVVRCAGSLTGRYLAGELSVPVPAQRRSVSPRRAIVLEGATANNLQGDEARFPLGALVCVTGVSGSGKSSLVNETLAKAIARKLHGTGPRPGPHSALRGASPIDKLVRIDQSPIGRTPRSNPATYTGVFDEIRRVFTHTRQARLRGYKRGRFSFNIKGGRCEECQGQGLRRIVMNFLPDLYVQCPVCEGARFNRQTLEIKFRDKSIADVLAMRVDEAREFFDAFPALVRPLATLVEVGLGYLALGQSAVTLSGGESQRIKLAAELGRAETGNTLYVLDEPTTGLHLDDVRKLVVLLGRLVDRGNTVIVIEHHLDVMKSADWIIDLGPEGGAAGGRIVAAGPPESIAALADNHTGRWLREALTARGP
jgi:excinuclease ABC subunit A